MTRTFTKQGVTLFSDLLHWSSFWLEGVGIAAVGAFGLCGNILTVIVLRSVFSAHKIGFR